jgi:hypothetical protein
MHLKNGLKLLSQLCHLPKAPTVRTTNDLLHSSTLNHPFVAILVRLNVQESILRNRAAHLGLFLGDCLPIVPAAFSDLAVARIYLDQVLQYLFYGREDEDRDTDDSSSNAEGVLSAWLTAFESLLNYSST